MRLSDKKQETRNKQFTENELYGREIMKKYFDKKGIIHYEFTEPEFDSFDGFFTGKTGEQFVIEIKTRSNYYDELFLEQSKLNKYNNLYKDKYKLLYINIIKEFNNNPIVMFNLSDENLVSGKQKEVVKKTSWNYNEYETEIEFITLPIKENIKTKAAKMIDNYLTYLDIKTPLQILKEYFNNKK